MHPLCFQSILLNLQNFWAAQGCCLLQPYDVEVGAGTFHPATVFNVIGDKPWRGAFVQPSRRPADGRYGQNPNRVQKHHQFQVILKPSPPQTQDLALQSFEAVGLDLMAHDIRFVEDNWASPTLGAAGLGWEVWCDGMEVLQLTYFQQMGGQACHPVCVEFTYGLERIAMNIQTCEDVYTLDWNGAPSPHGVTYGDIFLPTEVEFSTYNFSAASIDLLEENLARCVQECQSLLEKKLPLPAYDQCLHANHLFNVLDARGAFGVRQRAQYLKIVRKLAQACMGFTSCGEEMLATAPISDV